MIQRLGRPARTSRLSPRQIRMEHTNIPKGEWMDRRMDRRENGQQAPTNPVSLHFTPFTLSLQKAASCHSVAGDSSSPTRTLGAKNKTTSKQEEDDSCKLTHDASVLRKPAISIWAKESSYAGQGIRYHPKVISKSI
ncbi:hypothetical protein AA0111_g11784 [Alternaria arborescens]|uniref:hypothetical protein n=1 Tax=Alternaria arborescens TaxID=156630 RepID=UPI001074ACDB|nr:hypothetical protein AA0111_g11784 [Alternaria arborescens]RYO15139.1 hypothetical protein AA0111_g11784 [Alternaria arborescens]